MILEAVHGGDGLQKYSTRQVQNDVRSRPAAFQSVTLIPVEVSGVVCLEAVRDLAYHDEGVQRRPP